MLAWIMNLDFAASEAEAAQVGRLPLLGAGSILLAITMEILKKLLEVE